MGTIKHFENGKCVGEFSDYQAYHDFIVELTRRKCDAEYILSMKERDKTIRRGGVSKGFFIGCCYCIILQIIIKIIHHFYP